MKNISFEESDNLNLKTFSFEKETVHSENDMIRNLKDENGRLMKLLQEKDFEINKIKRNSEKQTIMRDNMSEGAASLKIIELSKKLREITAECESWKTRYYQKEKEAKSALNEAKEKERKIEGSSMASLVLTDSENDIRGVKEKLKTAESKVCELLTANQNMSRDLKIAMKVLESELGESCVDIGRLLKDTSQWRGRAQKIVSLRDTVDRLEKQLKEKPNTSGRDIGSGATSLGFQQTDLRHSSSTSALTILLPNRQNDILAKIDRDRKINAEKIEEDRKKMFEEHEKLRHTCEGLKARNKCLSDEVKSYKNQIKNMLDKTKNDDELIATLILQQDRLKNTLQSVINNQQSTQLNNCLEINHAASQNKQDHDTVNKLKEIIELKDKQLRNLKEISNNDINSGEDLNVDFEQLKISSASMATEVSQLRELLTTEELRLETLLQKNMVLSEENSRLKQSYLQIEREIQKISPNFKSKSKLKIIQSEEINDDNLSFLLSKDVAINKDSVERLQEELYLRIDKVQSLKSALELMSSAKKDDVKMLTDIIDQTRNQFVDGIKKLKSQYLTKEN